MTDQFQTKECNYISREKVSRRLSQLKKKVLIKRGDMMYETEEKLPNLDQSYKKNTREDE